MDEEDSGGSEMMKMIHVKIRVPDLNIEKCLQFPQDELIWEMKQQCIAALPKELTESFNYGLFCPPLNGRAGKFLDEERRLTEYPFPGSTGYLELKYKRRVYKMLDMDEKQLKTINSKTNYKKFIEHVNSGNVEKINKMCSKGLDPNFHCLDFGDTPLCQSTSLKIKSSKMIIALVNGGAILDFRAKDGSTAMHTAVIKNNLEALRTLLDLGASPNYKDGKGLTPLYYAITYSSDIKLAEVLLIDHANVGIQDLQGWYEIHQACRNGLVSHLEALLCYNANPNCRNASGNSPLHVCAVNNQEACAKILLTRGADQEALNFAGQTSYQVAVIAGNLELAEIIQKHSVEDIVYINTDAPKYNPRRRSSGVLLRTASDASFGRLESPVVHSLRSYDKPPSPVSPSPSDRSLPPFSSGSSLCETASSGSGSSNQNEEDLDSASTLAASLSNDPHCDVISLSSGVGTSSVSGSAGESSGETPPSNGMTHHLTPGTHVVVIESYSDKNSLSIQQGDIIQVTGSTDYDMLEGILRGTTGHFPANCVQEIRLRNPENLKQSIAMAPRILGRRELRDNRSVSISDSSSSKLPTFEARSVTLTKGNKGFGFVLRGAKAASPLMEMIPSQKCPGLQYMDDVDIGGVADLVGIKKGDFLLAINSEDVTKASHEHVVNLIRKSGDVVALTVVTVNGENGGNSPLVRQCKTLPRKLQSRSVLIVPPPPPKRDPTTTLSVGRAKAKSMVANLAALDVLDKAISEHDFTSSPSSFIKDDGQNLDGGRRVLSQEDINSSVREKEVSNRGCYTLPSKTQQKKMSNDRILRNPPPEHPPPPPPPPPPLPSSSMNQGFRSISSDYAALESPSGVQSLPNSPSSLVMSSFKPSDNAKLYASPESIYPVGYRIPQITGSPTNNNNNGPVLNPMNGITTVQVLKKPSRTNSMPSRPKPLILANNDEEGQQQLCSKETLGPQSDSEFSGVETYRVNGVKYTTYTTFRSPLTPPQNNNNEEPLIPEPDYDVCDEDEIISKSEKKKKKTVSFVMNEEIAAKLQAGKTTRVESILKDPNRTDKHVTTLQQKQSISNDGKLTKSHSFCTEKSPPKMCSPSDISVDEIKNARSQLKSSRSFPSEFTEDAGDNSSSGVSSDQEVIVSNNKYVTYLPVEGPVVKSGKWENDSESSDDVSDKSWILRAEKDDSKGTNIISMKKMLHPKVAALFDTPPRIPNASQTLPHRKGSHSNLLEARVRLSTHPSSSSSSIVTPPRSIEESLALITHHVHNLEDVNLVLKQLPPPPFTSPWTPPEIPTILAPPPGFSDSDSSDIEETERHKHRKKVLERTPNVNTSNFENERKEFKTKLIAAWNVNDVIDWLDSLSLSEYKNTFRLHRIDGSKLVLLTVSDFEKLGISQIHHKLNIEKSLKRYISIL